MLANQLARLGVRAVIVERNPGPSVRTKALGVQARTLEIYAHLGLADRAVELGTRGTGGNIWVEGRRAARVPFSDAGRDMSPYPFILILGQDDNERLLGAALREHGVDVQWNTELVDLVQANGHVSATLKRGDGSQLEITADWIAGCDGARSAVRNLSKIDFVGAPYEHVFFVADTQVSGPMVPAEVNVYLWRGGFHLFFPMRGADHWRVVGIVPPELRGRDDLEFGAVLPHIRKEVGSLFSFHACSWFSTYRIHHRRAARFHDRRCFLLGDAAHIHSPVGAQGMNTGLQDAYNLAWKLAYALQNKAKPSILDTYNMERLPFAKKLVATTDRVFGIVVAKNTLERFLTRYVAPLAMQFAVKNS